MNSVTFGGKIRLNKNFMKGILIVIIITLNASLVFSQEFNDKPLSVGLCWIDQKLSLKQLKKIIPKEYALIKKEKGKVEFTKEDSLGTYTLKPSFEKNELYSISVIFPIKYHADFTNEIMEDLDYDFAPSTGGGGPDYIEQETYFKMLEKEVQVIILLLNSKTNNVWVTLGGKKLEKGQSVNFQ